MSALRGAIAIDPLGLPCTIYLMVDESSLKSVSGKAHQQVLTTLVGDLDLRAIVL